MATSVRSFLSHDFSACTDSYIHTLHWFLACQGFVYIKLVLYWLYYAPNRQHHIVTGEKLWLDRGSNPGPLADLANTLPLSHPVISPTTFHLNSTSVTINLAQPLYL